MRTVIHNRQQLLPIIKPTIRQLCRFFLSFESIKTDLVIIHFVSEKEICELHYRFFHDSATTDCISLVIDGDAPYFPGHVLGEIFISPQAAIDYLRKKKSPLSNVYEELALYLVHSLLHLIGYRDDDSKAKAKMRRAEKRIFQELREKKILPSYNGNIISRTL